VSIDGKVDVALTFKGGGGGGGGGRSSSSNNNNNNNKEDNDDKLYIAFRCNFEDLVTWKFIYCKYMFTVIGANRQVKPPMIVNSAADRGSTQHRYCTAQCTRLRQ
jgi:hypothetical protein